MSSENRESPVSGLKALLTALVVFLGVGIIAAIVFCSASGHESVQDKAARGVFNQKTIDSRNQNLAEVTAAQSALVNSEDIVAAEKQLIASAASMKPAKSDLVVPGSPTFLKQMEAASAASAEAKKKAEAPKKAPPAPKPVETKPVAAPKKVEKAPVVKPKAPQPPKAGKQQPKPAAK